MACVLMCVCVPVCVWLQVLVCVFMISNYFFILCKNMQKPKETGTSQGVIDVTAIEPRKGYVNCILSSVELQKYSRDYGKWILTNLHNIYLFV